MLCEDAVQTPELPKDMQVLDEEAGVAGKTLSVSAKEFQPLSKASIHLRASAPEFVPACTKSNLMVHLQQEEVVALLEIVGFVGMNVVDVPKRYYETYHKYLDLTYREGLNLLLFLEELSPRCAILPSSEVPSSLQQALTLAGYKDGSLSTIISSNGEVMGCRDGGFRRPSPPAAATLEGPIVSLCPVPASARDQVIVSTSFSKYVNELRTFRETIVEVISNFARSTSMPETGLSLSLFSSEWDKFFIQKGMMGMPDFKSLRERFGIVKLMNLFQAIPGLDVSGTHPEVRVKLGSKAGEDVNVKQPLNSSYSKSLMLHEELFGKFGQPGGVKQAPMGGQSTSVIPLTNHISMKLVHQLLQQVEKQVLDLSGYLASKGLQLSSQDLIKIRLSLQQLQALKTSLSGLETQNVVSNNVPTRLPFSEVSTAANSRKASPVSSALSESDVKSLIVKIVERRSSSTSSTGIAVSQLPEGWREMYPTLPEFHSVLSTVCGIPPNVFNFTNSIKSFLSSIPSLHVFYATLPSTQLRVALKSPTSNAVTARSPLISPSSTCSYASETGERGVPTTLPQSTTMSPPISSLAVELVLKELTRQQVAAIGRANPELLHVHTYLHSRERKNEADQKSQQRLLESKRPPPIDTGGFVPSQNGLGQNAAFPLMKQFVTAVSELIGGQKLFDSVKIPVPDLAALWLAEYGQKIPKAPELIVKESAPLLAVSESGAILVPKLSATVSDIIESLFCVSDKQIWTVQNKKLLQLVHKFLATVQPPLSDLSSLLLKSIMASGPQAARECAEALRVLAKKDPNAIHQIVSQHVVKMQSAAGNADRSNEAAKAFINNLMTKGRDSKDRAVEPPFVYSRNTLLQVRSALIALPP